MTNNDNDNETKEPTHHQSGIVKIRLAESTVRLSMSMSLSMILSQKGAYLEWPAPEAQHWYPGLHKASLLAKFHYA